MFDQFTSTFQHLYTSMHYNLYFLLWMVGGLWFIQIINTLSGYRLNGLGIYPRQANGILGIVFSPFLHGSYQHLFLNSIPLFVLGGLMLMTGKYLFFKISFFIIVVSGLITWLLGRPAYHIGASGLILGYWGFLLCNAYIARSTIAVFLALLCLYYFGGFIFSLFPQEERISWESHLAGFLAGILACYLLAHFPGIF